jgi:DNA-binding transcriptional regulator YiaG
MQGEARKKSMETMTRFSVNLKAIAKLLRLNMDIGHADEHRIYSIEEVFPELHVGDVRRGFRTREEMTQPQLAAKAGVKVTHISEIERGK